jgi:hypothetical protein
MEILVTDSGQLRSFVDFCRLPTDRQQRLSVQAFCVAAQS